MHNKQSLIERMRQYQQKGESGVLSLARDEKSIRIYFNEGLIDAVSADHHDERLGQYLVKAGFVRSGDIDSLVAESRRKRVSLGETVVRKHLIDPAALAAAIRLQAYHLLKEAFATNPSVREFESNAHSFYMPARINLEHFLLELARTNPQPFEVIPDYLIMLSNGRHLSHLAWYPEELSVLSELKYPKTLQSLASDTGLEYANLSKILNVLHTLKLIAPVEGIQCKTAAEETTSRDRFFFEHLTPEVQITACSQKLEVLHNASSFISEQFKTLKVRIREFKSEQQVKVIAVSSPHPGDGKSLISVNLALSFSKDPGRRVILVDCDMRNPSLNKYLGISPEPGLIGYLENSHLQPQCYVRRLERLYIMTAGGTTPNPVELLSLNRMRDLIDYLKTEFDVIILDSPPLVPISDARILNGFADGHLMIVRRGKTPYRLIGQALKVLDPRKLIGVVFNDVKPMWFHTQYNYRYYHYGYHSLNASDSRRHPSHPKTYLEK